MVTSEISEKYRYLTLKPSKEEERYGEQESGEVAEYPTGYPESL